MWGKRGVPHLAQGSEMDSCGLIDAHVRLVGILHM